MKSKRGDILIENVIFIVLNVIFISLLMMYLWQQGSSAALLEQTYSKQIALIIDSAKPDMEIQLNMEKAWELADEEGIGFSEVVSITGNVVRVKLSHEGGHEYSFFNDVVATPYPDKLENGNYNGIYVFQINENE